MKSNRTPSKLRLRSRTSKDTKEPKIVPSVHDTQVTGKLMSQIKSGLQETHGSSVMDSFREATFSYLAPSNTDSVRRVASTDGARAFLYQATERHLCGREA
jgi:hypothetical protein